MAKIYKEFYLIYDELGSIIGIQAPNKDPQYFVLNDSGQPADIITFDTTPDRAVSAPGELGYNADEGCLEVVMNNGSAIQQIGLETYYRIKNQTGSTIPNGCVVRAVGAVGNSGHIKVAPMIGDGSIESYYNVGITTHEILNGDNGYSTHFGLVRGLNTSGSTVGETWVDGTVLYIHPSTPGALTSVEPTAPAVKLPLAMVISAHANNGSMFVRSSASHKIKDVGDVKASAPDDLTFLQYKASTGTWDANDIVWVDIDFPIIARSVATNNPSPQTLIGNITAPQWAVNDYLVCEGQELIHGWKEGSECRWHIHLITNGSEASDKYVRFEVEFAYAFFGGVVTQATTLTSTDFQIPANTATKTHLLLSIGSWTPPSDVKIGTQVYARLKRVATSNAGTYPAPASAPWVTMLQMHVQCNTVGSRNVGTK
jgi:hypothetical protein